MLTDMTATNDLDELRAAELRLQDAQRDSDVAALGALLHPELTFVGPDGALSGKDVDLQVHRDGEIQIAVLEPRDLLVNVLGGVGVTVLTARLAGSYRGQPFDGRMRYTRTWTKANGSWQVLAAQAGMVAGD
jgi:ketosteroid isomerase-like protein